MSADGDFEAWLEGLKSGDHRAVEVIWREYFEKVVHVARVKLGSASKRDQDEEDIALSAMHSFVRGAQRGRFPQLQDRRDLWRVLLTITARKIIRRRRRHFAAKRGRGEVRGESIFLRAGEAAPNAGIAEVLGNEPSPELAAEITESYQALIDQLDDPSCAEIVAYKLEGWTNAEIADFLQCATRTVERKLERIRDKWQALPLE